MEEESLGKVVDVVSKINTGAKYDSKVFKKSVGLNGVGSKAVNALSSYFKIKSIREGKSKLVEFSKGAHKRRRYTRKYGRKGTSVSFVPDKEMFGNYRFIDTLLKKMELLFSNTGLTILYNNNKFYSENGLFDLLTKY